jgi:hypothetical protein
VTTTTDLALTGAAAQFGRGLVQDVAAQLLDSFAYCLEQQLVTEQESSSAPAPSSPRPVSGLRLGAAAMRTTVGRHRRLTALLWASFFFLYLWLGMLAVDVSAVTAFVVSALLGAGIYVFIWAGSREDAARF